MSPGELPLVEELVPAPDVAATLRIFADWPNIVLFDSALRRECLGRYSFLAADPFWFDELRDVAASPARLAPPSRSRGAWNSQETGDRSQVSGDTGADPLTRVREMISRFPTNAVAGLPPFQGGAAGLLSYDLGRAWERIPPPRRDEFPLPALAVGLYDWTIAWDHDQNRTWIISQGFPETDPARRLDRAADRLARIRRAIERNRPDLEGIRQSAIQNPKSKIDSRHALAALPGLSSNVSRAEYLRLVARAIEYIHAGDIFQVNLSQRLLYPQNEPPLQLYLRLRERNPAPFAGFFAHDDWAIASASPERFVCLADGNVETRPIKGTRRRAALPEADLYTRDELRESEKDQAENVMIVDLLRNDLSRVCRPGTVRVPALCRVETYETVQHLVSEIRGQLQPGKLAWDLFAAVFPGGSITGAPKVRAMEIIAELEPTARGPYCGSLFYVSFDGRADSSILIRTFTIRDGWVQFPVGGGIVAQSNPEAEYDETMHKAEGMLRALR